MIRTEWVVEDAALAWLESLCYAVLHGPNIAAGETSTDPASCNPPSLLRIPKRN
jgi:hypothetical protein